MEGTDAALCRSEAFFRLPATSVDALCDKLRADASWTLTVVVANIIAAKVTNMNIVWIFNDANA